MICPNCGKELPEGLKFCIGCGKPLTAEPETIINDEESQPSGSNNQPEPPDKNGKSWWPIVALAIVALLAIVLVIVYITSNSNHDTTNQKQPASGNSTASAPKSPQSNSASSAADNTINSDRKAIIDKKPTVGGVVKFGAYEQDNNPDNGPEPIEWIVLNKYDDGRYLLLSVYGLDQIDYDTKDKVTSTDSYIYKWLNNDFFNKAFIQEEQAFIKNYQYSVVSNSKPVVLTDTKVALLSPEQIQQYLKSDSARTGKATAYAKARGAQVEGGNCWYWLQPSADTGKLALFDTHAACVNYDGSITEKISITKSTGGSVRPIICVKFQ